MAQIIEVDNGLVNLIERSVIATIPLAEWLPRIEKRSSIFTPVLPTGTRAVIWDPVDATHQKLVVLIEQPPQNIRMDFEGRIRELSIPYTRFFFYAKTNNPTRNLSWELTNYKVFMSAQRYQNPETQDMIAALMPNVYPDGRICFGSTAADANQTLADRLDSTTAMFWSSRFNRDLSIRFPNGWRGYAAWETMTRNDPTSWMEWPDLNPNQTTRTMRSFNSLLVDIPLDDDRFEPMVTPNGIPEVPLGATFGRINEWWDGLTGPQRTRIAAVAAARPVGTVEATTTDDEEDFEEDIDDDDPG